MLNMCIYIIGKNLWSVVLEGIICSVWDQEKLQWLQCCCWKMKYIVEWGKQGFVNVNGRE